ncbi:hypothetical protein CWB85_19720 [Pseudoalteromonas sp. S1727]|uniref:VpaChn25_0724 family phage protein n=1 Tax=Pseudoalteromonas sp. S1727 TaxID=2066514 RepID=UPI0011088875|nr:hypothetical protein [Pseudoalteromonas sp. S1727]TMN67280.1 hypothetical protein CWB85_19720 [Pseudoalteromonas sp. S1727]
MAINQIIAEHSRLCILRALNEQPGYDLNDSIICDILKSYSLKCGRDELHTHLNWLERNGYVTIEKIGQSSTWVSTITPSGIDVAEGTIVVPGIKRPSPRG